MIIGAPKIEQFPPLNDQQLNEIIQQIQGGFNQGVRPEMPVSMPVYAIASLIQTIFAMQNQFVITAGLLKHCIDSSNVDFTDEHRAHLTQIFPTLFPPPDMPNIDEILNDGTQDNDKDK